MIDNAYNKRMQRISKPLRAFLTADAKRYAQVRESIVSK